jgi:hypothetical protein
MLLAKAFPHLRFCVQDRPKVVELGLSVSHILNNYTYIYTKVRLGKIRVQNYWNLVVLFFRVHYWSITLYSNLSEFISAWLLCSSAHPKCLCIRFEGNNSWLAWFICCPHPITAQARSYTNYQTNTCGLHSTTCLWRCLQRIRCDKDTSPTRKQSFGKPRSRQRECVLVGHDCRWKIRRGSLSSDTSWN